MKENLLSGIPKNLRKNLFDSFNSIIKNFRELRWEPAELNGGKFAEVVYCILQGYIDGNFPLKVNKPRNFLDACKNLEKADEKKFPRSIRIQIPRMLIALYEIRNNRGVGHVGGDVNPNHMDAQIVIEMSKWIFAELIRIFHHIEPSEATNAVEALTSRTIPMVWAINGDRRVLQPTMSRKDQVLLLLWVNNKPVRAGDLVRWIEYSNFTVFKKNILIPAHKDRLIEFNQSTTLVTISPTGIKYVEQNLPLSYEIAEKILGANHN